MFHQKSSVFALLSVLAICIVLTSFLPACSGGSGDGAQVTADSDDSIAMPPGTGAITFGVVWQPPSSGSSSKILMAAAFNSCVDYGIDTISATVLSGTTTIASSSFPCSLHKGNIPGVPAGSNYTLQIRGMSSGTIRWSGSKTPVTVSTGQVTSAGTVTMTYAGTDSTPPTVTVIGPNSNPANTASVPVTDRIRIVFSEPMGPSTVSSTNITLRSGITPIQGTVSYDNGTNTAAFIPSVNLAYNTQYVLQVLTGIKDTAGNQLSTSYSVTFTTESDPVGLANQPSGLTASAGNGQVRLDWPAVNGATSYNIYYSTSSPVSLSTGTQIPNVKAPSIHLDINNGTTYHYIVTAATLGYGESLASNQASATPTFPGGNNPAAPASLVVDYTNGYSYTVTWPTVSGLSYNLYWSPRPIYPDHNAADNVIRYVTGGQYVHSGVEAGVTYCYIVTAINSAGESADSKQVCGPGAGSVEVTWQ